MEIKRHHTNVILRQTELFLQRIFFLFWCHNEAELKRQLGAVWFGLCLSWWFCWQSTELVFYAVSLCRPCQDSLLTTHFLFKKYVRNGYSVWSFLWIKFVMCFLWLHFIWSVAVKHLAMKTPLVYVLFYRHRRDRTWINDDFIWNKNLVTEILQAFLYFIMASHISILFFSGFSFYKAIIMTLYWCALIFYMQLNTPM